MKTRVLISALCIVFFSLVSCKKDKEAPASCDATVANLLGSYKLTAEKVKVGSSETDILHLDNEECELDDITNLKSDGSYTYTDAGVNCGFSDDYVGSWSVSGNTFTLDGNDATIVSFDCHNLVISESNGAGTITSTYTK